jgi:EAL domain-containing protein (putative c-di-GMP-specific phosphodiesterase class I)
MRRLALSALEDAGQQAARWEEAGLDLSASVNLSVLNLLDLGSPTTSPSCRRATASRPGA